MGFEARLEPQDETPEDDGYRELKLVWFQANPGLSRRFVEGESVRVAGRVHDYRGAATIAHPETLLLTRRGRSSHATLRFRACVARPSGGRCARRSIVRSRRSPT
jgi:RecG-like helicase